MYRVDLDGDWRCQTCSSHLLAMKVDGSKLIIYCTNCYASAEIPSMKESL